MVRYFSSSKKNIVKCIAGEIINLTTNIQYYDNGVKLKTPIPSYPQIKTHLANYTMFITPRICNVSDVSISYENIDIEILKMAKNIKYTKYSAGTENTIEENKEIKKCFMHIEIDLMSILDCSMYPRHHKRNRVESLATIFICDPQYVNLQHNDKILRQLCLSDFVMGKYVTDICIKYHNIYGPAYHIYDMLGDIKKQQQEKSYEIIVDVKYIDNVENVDDVCCKCKIPLYGDVYMIGEKMICACCVHSSKTIVVDGKTTHPRTYKNFVNEIFDVETAKLLIAVENGIIANGDLFYSPDYSIGFVEKITEFLLKFRRDINIPLYLIDVYGR